MVYGGPMDLDSAIKLYLEGTPFSGTRYESLVAAGLQAARWRSRGPTATALILRSLRLDHGLALRRIEELTGIPHNTASRLIAKLERGEL